ncbi:MAG: 50S ribosomal protein L11 [Candidatus Nanohaloarchaeota archaeon QJJ-5]|nr:50S ribosomal protein L11 [Candidatus Nanohaloarchaeota archaeon QJJ-5]
MAEKTISALVDGGNASAGPPLGPELGPLPVDIGQVVAEINQKTDSFDGMEVPVDVIVDEDTGEFEVEVGTPPVAELLKEKAGIESGSGEPNKDKVADLDFETIKQVAEMKRPDLVALDLRGACKEVIGSAVSMGVTVDGEDGRVIQQRIDEGEYDDQLGGE